MKKIDTQNEDYLELKQNIFEYLQLLPFCKEDIEQTEWVRRRIDFCITRMLHIKRTLKDGFETD